MSIASRITSIENHIGDIYDTLELGGAELTNVDKNLFNISPTLKQKLIDYMNNGTQEIWNNWDKVTGTGESVTLNGTIQAPIKLGVGGNTKQEGTPSPEYPSPIKNVGDDGNLLNNTVISQTKNGVEIVVNEDKSITFNGTCTANFDLLVGYIENLKER